MLEIVALYSQYAGINEEDVMSHSFSGAMSRIASNLGRETKAVAQQGA